MLREKLNQLSTKDPQPTDGLDAMMKLLSSNRESFQCWPSLIKIDAAVKAKVEKLLDP